MNPQDILQQRAEAHAAACADLDNDILIQHLFGPPPELKPLPSPVRAGALLRRQAE